MELSILLANQIASLFIILGIGFGLTRSNILKVQDSRILSLITLYVLNPCSIINSYLIAFNQETFNGLLLAILAAIIIQFLMNILSNIFGRIFKLNHIEIASVIYTNAGNLIIPLVAVLLGDEWVIYASGYIMVQTTFMWTHGKNLVRQKKGFKFKDIFKNLNVIAVIIGLICFLLQLKLPSFIGVSIKNLGSMLGTSAMLTIGMSLGHIKFKEVVMQPRNYLVCVLRLIVIPFISILFIHFSGLLTLHPQARQILLITTLAVCAPVAATISQFATLYQSHPKEAGAINVLSVIMCIITMPVMVYFYQIL